MSVKENTDYYIAQVYMPVNNLSINYLLSYGDKVECVEPLSMRAKMLEITGKLYKMYKTGNENIES